VVVAAAVLAGCSASADPPSARTNGEVRRLTAYVGPGAPGQLHQVASGLGCHFTLATDYLDDRSWSGIADDQWDLARWQGSGYRMVWGVPMLPTSGGVSLAQGAQGSYNAYFVQLAQHLVAAGMGRSILRLGWEFNQRSNPWYAAGQPAQFVGYWRQIVTSMRSVPGTHFEFEWNPDRGDNGGGDAAMGNLAAYYPGSSYVDVVALDVYDTAWRVYPGAAAEFQTVLTQRWGLDWLSGFGQLVGKPLAIGELGRGDGPAAPGSGPVTGPGAVSGGDNPVFVSDVVRWMSSHHVVESAFWDVGPTGMLSTSSPSMAGVVRHLCSTN